MAAIERVSRHVAFLHLGRIVETGPRAAVYGDSGQPYSRLLLAVRPAANPRRRRLREDCGFKPIWSPDFPVGHEPRPSESDEVAPGRLVLGPRKA